MVRLTQEAMVAQVAVVVVLVQLWAKVAMVAMEQFYFTTRSKNDYKI
jgi:hypothetical protein